ncbi:MAG: hypothetical protein IKW10_00100 [Oscillospiraceae bacterium]|nr:hypothetical protein [Oscillospiraceae bacterium]
MQKKTIITIILVMLLLTILCGCEKDLYTTGCRVIHEEGDYVTYQTVCDNCGYEYGDPTTTSVYSKLFYTVNCTRCGEIIYVRLERK